MKYLKRSVDKKGTTSVTGLTANDGSWFFGFTEDLRNGAWTFGYIDFGSPFKEEAKVSEWKEFDGKRLQDALKPDTKVSVVFRFGGGSSGIASDFEWRHNSKSPEIDVVKYRIDE